NLPDGYQCEKQADCISNYCYDKDGDGRKTCQSSASSGSDSGLEISDTSDCPAPACHIRGTCYSDNASIQFKDQTVYCDDGELRTNLTEAPAGIQPGELASDAIAEFRNYTFKVVDTVVNSDKLQVVINFTNQESSYIQLNETYISGGYDTRKYVDADVNLSTGETKKFNITVTKPQNGFKLFYAESRISGEFGEQWATSNTTCYVSGWNGFQKTCITDDPEVQTLTFSDYPNKHEFNITATAIDPDGAQDITSCRIDVEEEDKEIENTYYGDLIQSYGTSNEIKCEYDSINDSISEYDPNDNIRTIVTFTDNAGKTGREIDGHILPNRAPTHDRPEITPDPALSGDDLNVSNRSVSDAEDDPVSFKYNWTLNGNDLKYNGTKLLAGNTSVDDSVKVYVTPSDPYDTGTTRSYSLTVREANVTVLDVHFQNYQKEHAFNVSAVINATDPTGTDTCEITVDDSDGNKNTYSGTLDDTFGGDLKVACNYTKVSSSVSGWKPTETMIVDVFAEDENNANDTKQETHAIPNTPPNVTTPSISPDPARDGSNLQGSAGTSSDIEGDSVTFEYNWYVNSTDTGYGGTKLLSGNFSAGDNVTFETVPYDGFEYGAGNNTTVTITSVNLSIHNLTAENYSSQHAFNVTADIAAADTSDINRCDVVLDDNDGNVYLRSGTLDKNYAGSGEAKCSYSRVDSSTIGFSIDENISIKVNASTDSNNASSETWAFIPNRPPTTTEPSITPSQPTDKDNLTGELGTTSDAEGDSTTVQFKWYVDGTQVHSGNMSVSDNSTLLMGNFSAGDTIEFNVTPHDSWDFGKTNFTTVNIQTAALKVKSLTLTNFSDSHGFNVSAVVQASNDDKIDRCELNATDGEGYFVGGNMTLDKTYGTNKEARCTWPSINSSTTGFLVTENISVNLTVYNSTHGSTDIEFHNIPNRPPVFDATFTEPVNPVSQDNVTLNANITEPEGDSVISVNFTVIHENGTRLVDNVNGSFANGTWSSPEFGVEPQKTYSWFINATDPWETRDRNDSFKTINDKPIITSFSVENVTGYHGYNVSFIVNDGDGTQDLNTCSLEAWDGDGNGFSDTASMDTSYGDSKEAECVYSSINSSTTGFNVNEIIDFNISVSDSAGQSTNNSSSARIPNRVPTIALDAPEDNQSVTEPIALAWAASDKDGDSLTYNVTVARLQDMTGVVLTNETTSESFEVTGLNKSKYYWQVDADDSYTTAASGTRSFRVVSEIENVSIELRGNFQDVKVDDTQVTPGVFTDVDFPYIVMENQSVMQGLLSYGSFKRARYSTSNGKDIISLTQGFTGQRILLVANNGTSEAIEDRQDEIQDNEFFNLAMASFTGTIPEQNEVMASISYDNIDLIGTNETITPGGNVEIVVRNMGVKDGNVQVKITEK
ncbi:MAG: hypothetical protein ABEI58_00365, partial [Candidatus Nanohaloarchaea archaeon]